MQQSVGRYFSYFSNKVTHNDTPLCFLIYQPISLMSNACMNEENEILAGICNWKKEMMRYDDYKLFVECMENAKIKAEYLVMFSAGKFDNSLRQEAKKNPYLALVSVEQVV